MLRTGSVYVLVQGKGYYPRQNWGTIDPFLPDFAATFNGSQVRELGGLPLVLNLVNTDESNPCPSLLHGPRCLIRAFSLSCS